MNSMSSEPVNFAEREPELLDFMDGVNDDAWEQEYGNQLKQDQLVKDEDSDESKSSACLNDQFLGNPLIDYSNELPMYYSSIEQVQLVRQRLDNDWEPWLCERLDALMPRMINEMNLTQKLTQVGLSQFCQLRSANQTKSLSIGRSYHALNNLLDFDANEILNDDMNVNVFSVFEAEKGTLFLCKHLSICF